jgi:hypothetical protein
MWSHPALSLSKLLLARFHRQGTGLLQPFR